MKINEETTVSEEQVLFNKLRYEDQELIIKIMRTLQPCELSCEIEEEKEILENNFNYVYSCEDEHIMANFENIKTTLKDIIDYLKSKGDE